MITLKNNLAAVTVDLYGGAIVDFHLHENSVNPLCFKFSPDQMPANNKPGACWQGHFVCLGRWGQPSAGEIKAGHPQHGQSAIIEWEQVSETDRSAAMQVYAPLDALNTLRTLTMSQNTAAFEVVEKVRNIGQSSRLYNIVQHPTLAAPFLDAQTLVDSNATFGINYNFETNPLQYAAEWPEGLCENGEVMNVTTPDIAHNSVFSYIVNADDTHGWITAYSPASNLLLGYIWKREDYPWISVWQHFEADVIKYRGIEFGTTGIHKPFDEILQHDNSRLFGEATIHHIDAGEQVSRAYGCFLLQTDEGFAGVDNISLKNGNLIIQPKQGEVIELETGFNHL
jgi:hypothetical protein